MEKKKEQVLIRQFKEMLEELDPCMDDFLYVLDYKNDYYCISPSAVERFHIPSSQFHDVNNILRSLVYEQDFQSLSEDLDMVFNRKKDFHNMQYRWLDKEGNPIWINCRGRVILDDEENPEYLVGCINEIGKKPKADNVSGLLGEFSLQTEMKNIGHCDGFVLRIGIDDFKDINENKGIDYGDMILRKTAECISAVVAPEQKLYRIVADEFMVVDFCGEDAEDAEILYDTIKAKINCFIEEIGYEVFYTVSGGVLQFCDVEDQSYLNLMKLSGFALCEAKKGGKNKLYRYVEQDYLNYLREKELLQILRRCVKNNFEGFETYFQPIMNTKGNEMFGAETLLRFCTEETGMVSPVKFIPLLEESGLIIPVGKWVLDQAMQACRRIQEKMPDFKASVNLSYIQVMKSNVLNEIVEGMERYGLKKGSVIIEITESGFLESNMNLIHFCEGLKMHGIPIALDDFGTGYSNFHYLYNLNPSTIKIDRSFTLKALNSDYEFNLLRHMVEMAHSINLTLCIEGIETGQELGRICEIRPDYIQGYYYGKPCPLETFIKKFVK